MCLPVVVWFEDGARDLPEWRIRWPAHDPEYRSYHQGFNVARSW